MPRAIIASLIILAAIAVFAPMPAAAQEQVRGKIPQGWERLFPAEKESAAQFIAPVSEGRTVVVGYDVVVPNRKQHKVWVRMLDPNGELIWERYLDPKLSSFDSATIHKNMTIYVLANAINPISPNDKINQNITASNLVALDFQGNILWSKNLFPNGNNLLSSITPASNGNLLLAGNIYPYTTKKKSWITLVNIEGETIWNTTTGFGDFLYIPTSLKQLSDNTIITLGAVFKRISRTKSQRFFNQLVFYDKNGNEFNRVRIDPKYTSIWDSIIDLNNGHFMVYMYIKAVEIEETEKLIPTACFLTFDYGGNLVSEFKYDITPEGWHIEDVIKVPNDFLISTEPRFFPKTGLDVCLNLIDSKGEIKAQHFYHRKFRDLVSRIAYSPDGYLLLAGAQGVDHIGRLEAWVAKLPIPQAMQQLIANPHHQQ